MIGSGATAPDAIASIVGDARGLARAPIASAESRATRVADYASCRPVTVPSGAWVTISISHPLSS
jgi:hypothetical protein